VKRAGWIALLGAVAFAVILIAGLPAAWLVPGRIGPAACVSVDGSLWSGTCTGLTLSGAGLGNLSWELHPLRLFVGRLGAHLTLSDGPADAAADVELGFGQKITIAHATANTPLDPKLIPGVPSTLSGRAQLDIALAQFDHGVLKDLKGRIEAHDLVDTSGHRTALGSYVVSFPGGTSPPAGELRDLEGPLALEGTLKLTPQPGFEVQGLVATRNNAPPELVNNVRFLGSPDASGRRPFSLSGSF
jgi:general secretion pathway protein N